MPTNLSNKKNSNIARSHNLRFMARAMVAYLIVAQLVTKRQIIGAPDKPCGVGRADANPKLLLNDT